jgi:serine/threonine protein kinase
MAARILSPNNYLKIGPQKAYVALGETNYSIQEEVPKVFSCDFNGYNLVLKEGYSTYTFPSGKTFHDVLETSDYTLIKKMGSGASNTTELIEIEGQRYLLRRPTYLIDRNKRNNSYLLESSCGGYFRECVHLAILSPSPYIMNLYAAECSPTQIAMLLEYVEGTTLTKWLENKPSKEEKERVRNELIKGLEYIHSRFVAHYDIKSDNVFVPSDTMRPPFFIDFGSSGRSHKNNNMWPGMKDFNWSLLSAINFKGGSKLKKGKSYKLKTKKYNKLRKTRKNMI